MELVMTKGRVELLPIPGEAEGSRAGYYLRITDQDGSNITVVAPLPWAEAGQLAEAISGDMAGHVQGDVAGHGSIEVAPASALRVLGPQRGR